MKLQLGRVDFYGFGVDYVPEREGWGASAMRVFFD